MTNSPPPGRPLVKKFSTVGTQLFIVAESSSGQEFGISRVGPARKSSFLGHVKNRLFTKREVKMAGYWPRYFLRFY